MKRLAAVDPIRAEGQAKQLLDMVHSALGKTPNMMRTMANSPTVLEAYLNFNRSLAGGVLSPKLREQIALPVGEANRCEYCVSAHTFLGRKAGLNEAELAESRRAASPDGKTAAALKFSRSLVERRGEVAEAELRELREFGFSDGEIAEIIAHVALNIFTNYFNKAAGVEVDFPRVTPGVDAPATIR